ncbi:DUF3098 domain-containing protein [Robertkochia flava]|uniref:DUF3098 domain-containing protein n=1 Tax=Robertkochia flava TaxID=3447986 RepID=UPI001CCF6C7F|nr:DUF3098 domain-containing protein [Robertkochia marina]
MKKVQGKNNTKDQASPNGEKDFVFHRKNYTVMFIGLAIIVLGFILMSGGGSDNPEVFNPDIFSFRRIRLAPTLVLIGFGIEVYAILMNPHKKRKNK